MSWLLIAVGLALLVAGGEALIRGSVSIASKLGMSKALIGVTLIGFGTSMPEFVATFGAAAKGSPDIAFGNVLGSNIANILMILGVSTLIHPIATRMHGLWRDALFVSLSAAASVYWIYSGGITFWGAAWLLAAFATYMFFTIRADIADEIATADDITALPKERALPLSLLFAIGGIAALVLGAEALIRGASDIALGMGVSEAMVGITIVGIGTSLPEATASIIASLKRENEIAFANIVGSNIFNGLGILGITGLFHTLTFSPASAGGFTLLDAAILCTATFFMFFFAVTHKRIMRWEGALLLLAYGGYLGWLVTRALG
ncbi:calcium/sodium antiporter [Litorimonas sp. RW-G-Af-16]|uniref:calcium/sodium antiporter n=1 Tax=Litorimonas sp. RW-G-Af-16 TaxID=3241168 RepID=UPI00390C9880